MAVKYICDRCESSSNDSDDLTKIDIEYVPSRYGGANRIKADLCVKCLNQLAKFVKPFPKIAPAGKIPMSEANAKSQ